MTVHLWFILRCCTLQRMLTSAVVNSKVVSRRFVERTEKELRKCSARMPDVLDGFRTGHQLNKGTCFTIVAYYLDKICA